MSDNYKEFLDNIRKLLTAIKDDERCQKYIESNETLKSFIDVLTLHLISPTEEQKEEVKLIPWENKVKVGTYFQIIDPTVKDFGEVKKFTRLDIEDDDMYLVFFDGYGCDSKVILPYDVHFDSIKELRNYHMAELASKEDKWITAILPEAQNVELMNYFQYPDCMTEKEIPTSENDTRVVLIPPPDRCGGSYAGIYDRNKDGDFNDFIYKTLSNIMSPSNLLWALNSLKTLPANYTKWSYTVDYEIPKEMKEKPISGRPEEKKSEEKVEEEIADQPNTESTTDVGSEDLTSWTHKVSGFFKHLFKK